MKCDTYPPFDPQQLIRAISTENEYALRELFKGKIQIGFLNKIKRMVFEKLGTSLLKYYPIYFDNARIFTGTDATPEYDICRIIVGVHRHYSIFLSEEEIRGNQKNKEYQEQITNEVIEKIKLAQFSCLFYRRKQLFLGDEFLFFPVPYELFAICMRSIALIEEHMNSLLINYIDLIGLALSSLSLMENNFLSNAYPLCRSMIELYLKTLTLKMHPEVYRDYERFCSFEIEQACCSQSYPKEFIELYSTRKDLNSNSKVNYLHYGWLDSIDGYNPQNTSRYSIYGIICYLKSNSNSKDELDIIERLYKMCHGYTHGSAVHVKYPLLQYFEISIMICHVIKSIFYNIHLELKRQMLDKDRALIDMLERDFKTLYEQYEKRSTDNFELYYKIY